LTTHFPSTQTEIAFKDIGDVQQGEKVNYMKKNMKNNKQKGENEHIDKRKQMIDSSRERRRKIKIHWVRLTCYIGVIKHVFKLVEFEIDRFKKTLPMHLLSSS